jgi:two-component system NarL family sensor kinase
MRAFIAPSRGLSRARRSNYRSTLHIPPARPAGEAASAVGRLACAAHDHGTPLDFRLVFSSLQVGYLKIDRGYVVRDVNAVALDWLGLTRSDVIGCPFSRISPRSPMTMLRSVVEGTVYIDKEQISYRRPDRYMVQHIYPAEDGAILLFRDITEQKRAQTGAARTQKLLQASLDALVAQVVVLDQSGTVIASNQAWQRFAVGHGFIAANDAGPLHYFSLYAEPHVRRTDARRIASALAALLEGHRRSVHLVYALQVAGQVRWFHLSAARFAVENEIYVAVTSEDVTAVKEAQHTLGEASERLMELRDEERRRIAEELHDSTAQHLVAIGLNVMGLQTRKDPRGSQALLREIEESLEEASRELRSFTYLLHPPRLEQDGLHLTLQRYVEGFARRTGLKLALRLSAEVDGLTFALQITIFRIVQEGLANVHRHASASRVAIDLRVIRGQLHLIVSDDGRGFKPGIGSRRDRDAPSRMGVGIPGIKARLRQFGGELVVRSGQNGTRLHGVMPVHAVPAGGGPEIVAPVGAGLISPPLAVRRDVSLDVLHHHDATVRGTDQS